MDELLGRNKFYSGQAARLSREATQAFEGKDWKRGRALMKEAVAASKNCHLFNRST